MLSRQKLAEEYIRIINTYYPIASRLLHQCLVKIITFDSDKSKLIHYYLGIYYPEAIGKQILAHQQLFQDAAENMGLMEVIFLNVNNLVADPDSKIKQQDFRFWLELCWLVDNTN